MIDAGCNPGAAQQPMKFDNHHHSIGKEDYGNKKLKAKLLLFSVIFLHR
jgi:hypothetical protein